MVSALFSCYIQMHRFTSHRNCFGVYAMFTPKQQKDNLDPNDVKCIFEGYPNSQKLCFIFQGEPGNNLLLLMWLLEKVHIFLIEVMRLLDQFRTWSLYLTTASTSSFISTIIIRKARSRKWENSTKIFKEGSLKGLLSVKRQHKPLFSLVWPSSEVLASNSPPQGNTLGDNSIDPSHYLPIALRKRTYLV